ncbi:uncharacterized protein B0H18DRAFT_978305 [Fomitopsis serialis]|uniref:uncharacterized protein n=1 Tax=Fomitopsis serialis TaxID=139415 RepID=UPI002007AE20|nr:uncharacterized protein B0H18DRAFT_978305 [Neoantrodia serialis]KAH9934795.1 hypothetical protein B0H18DRAFT_978305 [Neoantrodia serialis]
MSSASKHAAAAKLGDLARLPLDQPEQWNDVESTARGLADELRVKDVEQQTLLGQSVLPQTITSLFKTAFAGSEIPNPRSKAAVYELLRVGANLCMDHDENRGHLLRAGYLDTVVQMLENYALLIPPAAAEPLPLSIPDLKVVKTSIGLLLNASIGYELVKARLTSIRAAMTTLKLSMALYPPGSWLTHPELPVSEGSSDLEATILESWNLRSGLSSWTWRSRQLFGADALPYLVRPLKAFVPPYTETPSLFVGSPARHALVQQDYDLLEETCGLLESLSLDVDEVRLSLGRILKSPDGTEGGAACLKDMLEFLDKGDYPPYWSAESPSERASMEKGLDMCKAAVVKAVVEVAGEQNELWDDSNPEKPGGEFVDTMVQWIRSHGSLKERHREDLIICATLSLGNLATGDAHSIALVKPPVALAPNLAQLLEPLTDIKVKHGIVGLLKHLAQAQSNRAVLGEASIIERLASCQIWDEKADMAERVQVSAIGIAKYMCNANVENVFSLIAQPQDDSAGSALDQILALVRRSDSIAVKSEGTRVLVNVVKSLWSSDSASDDSAKAQKRRECMAAVANAAGAAALAQLVGRSKKYPILINEGVVALSLLSTHANGGTLVLDAIMNPLPSEVIRPSQSQPVSAIPTEGSPDAEPRTALDMLLSVLRNSDAMPAEVRSNVCALLGQLGRKGVVGEDRAEDLARMKGAAKELLERLAADSEGSTQMVSASARRALEAWA